MGPEETMAKFQVSWAEPTGRDDTEIEADRFGVDKSGQWVEFYSGAGAATRIVASVRGEKVAAIQRLAK
jgi:hypothetical protein